MKITTVQPLYRRTYDAESLVKTHPAKIRHANKTVLYEIACPPECIHGGRIEVSRWAQMEFPIQVSAVNATKLEPRADVFDYEAPAPGFTDWHLNFSNADLFCAYGAAAFAQDEIQVAEHPALASLREALIAEHCSIQTIERNNPTPILIRGVERRCAVSTDEIYGRKFARAKREEVANAIRRIQPPTQTNIIAMEAPVGGFGKYTLREIELILTTAFTGFAAARNECPDTKTAVHTGFWGCGAYGGNRILMALLQILAARLAGIERLVFHAVNSVGESVFSEASKKLDKVIAPDGGGILSRSLPQKSEKDQPVRLNDVLQRIEGLGFMWGEGDGN